MNKTLSPAAGKDAAGERFRIFGVSPKVSNKLE
jgi:hypothetical protein